MASERDIKGDRPAAEVLNDRSESALSKYGELAAGRSSIISILTYDLITGLFGPWPGMSGYALRRFFYGMILNHMGKKVTIGRNVSFRGAGKISLGDNAFIDDGCMIAARGDGASLVIENDVLVACNSIVRTRSGELTIGSGSSVGSNCILATDSRLDIGPNVLVGAFSYICAGGSHEFNDKSVPVIKQACTSKGGVSVGEGVWIGAHVTVLDGAKIGRDTIIGAGSLVKGEVPEMSVVYGSPARVRRSR